MAKAGVLAFFRLRVLGNGSAPGLKNVKLTRKTCVHVCGLNDPVVLPETEETGPLLVKGIASFLISI